MTVVDVDGEDLGQADKDVVLDVVLGIYEWSKLLSKVNGLIDGDLRCLFLILLEEEGQSIDDLVPRSPTGLKAGAVLEHVIILAELGQEVVKWFDGAGAKDLIKNVDLGQEKSSDLFKAAGKLSNISQGYLKIVSKVRILITLKT